MKKRIICHIGIVASIVIVCAAGRPRAQSIFGLNFIGEHRYRGNARHRSLAFSTLAVPDSASAITPNTASLADLKQVTFSIYEVLGLSRISRGGNVVNQNRFQLPTVMIAVPIGRGFVCGVGYRTRFESKGDFAFRREFEGDPTPYEIYKRRSSLFTAPLVLTWKFKELLRVGGELQIERGSIRDQVTIDFEAEGYMPSTSIQNRIFSGTSWGMYLLITPVSRLSIGAGFDDRISYDVDQELRFSYEEFNSVSVDEFTLPPAFSIGVAAGITERWWMSSTFWSREAPEPRCFEELSGSLGREWMIAFGIERRGSPTGGFFSRRPLRFGYYQNRWHLEFPSGKGIFSRFITFGTGFPMPGGPGTLDFSIEFGQIGSIDDNGIDEQVVRCGLGLNVSEVWSRRRGSRR
ncbi:MAG: hypothetical protein JSV33_14325 [bacterium]|nr:MAG: hypothetical protein JSV33_14325 [bacterium]